MDICIFYSWQGMYRDNCDKIICKALEKAVRTLNKEQQDYNYIIKRGGGDVVGEEDIPDNIDKIISTEADIALVDFTHIGVVPQRNPETGDWVKVRCQPNANATNEHGKLVMALDKRQVFKVSNIAYGQIDVNLEPPFDLRQKHYPVSFFCNDATTDEERVGIRDELAKEIQARIEECTKAFIENQKIRYSPLSPLRNEYLKKMWQGGFKKTQLYENIYDRITAGQSFRLLGLPGLGKTRLVGEAFRGRENDVYYCDCRKQVIKDVEQAVERLMEHRGNKKQTVILDNCSQRLSNYVTESINENGYNCLLITIHYDPREDVESGTDGIIMKLRDVEGVVEGMLDSEPGIPKDVGDSIIGLSGGFPLMAKVMMENHLRGISIVNISKKDVFERMLGIDTQNASDQDKLKVLTAFSIFKFIGLYGNQEKHGRFIASNRIVTNIHGTEDENLQLFKEVHELYSKKEILEREGNVVLMRLIPLAVYLCKSWFDKQSTESIGELIAEIRSQEDEGTRNMLIESLSRRITLMAEVPLAKELNEGLTNPDKSPFLAEEVVLSTLGSRLFLAFSEVNPEACSIALYRIMIGKTDEEIKAIEPARRNLAWALDHLAFDKRSFYYAMMTLARFAIVETEDRLSNNTTGLFVDRFPIFLSGTEVDLMSRLSVLKELSRDNRYEVLIKRALHRALNMGNFYRTGGAEKQGTRLLKDYRPSREEVATYLNASFEMLLSFTRNEQDLDDIAKTMASNSRWYYLRGMDDFLIRGLEEIAPKRDFIWEEMKDSLSFLIEYDAIKRNNYRLEEIEAWRMKLTKDDYVYKLLNVQKEISRHYGDSFEQEQKRIRDRYQELAEELIDKELYKEDSILSALLKGECYYFNSYGYALSAYSLKQSVQKDLLDKIVDIVLNREVSRDGESLLVYFLINVKDRELLEETYYAVLQSEKKRLLPAMYAIKTEGRERIDQLFELLNQGSLVLDDFSSYFSFLPLDNYDVKYIASRLLEYGTGGAQLVLSRCHNFLFGNQELDDEYDAIGRQCLMSVDLHGAQIDDFVFIQSMNNYLTKHHDEEMALHIQELQERAFAEDYFRDNYYLGRLYRKVLKRYTDLLRPRIFELLEKENVRHSWMKLLRTSFPQDDEKGSPIYKIIPNETWFGWLEQAAKNERAYALAMIFCFDESQGADPDMLRLIDNYWCDDVKSAIRSRFHSFSWAGTGIPLYKSRIMICNDYIAKLTNEDAKKWFEQDIGYWESEIEQERLGNALNHAIYD